MSQTKAYTTRPIITRLMISQALRSRIYLCKNVRSEGPAVHILHQCDIIALSTG